MKDAIERKKGVGKEKEARSKVVWGILGDM